MVAQTLQEEHRARLIELSKEMMEQRPLILASNRGPVEFRVAEGGKLRAERGRGGVVTALSAINQFVPLTWIAAAMSEGDRRAARSAESGRIRSPLPGQKLQLRFVVSPKAVYYKYYNVFCNPLIWFLQHYMWNSPTTPNINESTYDAWENGYIAVNHAFAQAVITEGVESEVPPFVMLHDYHLYLAAGEIRAHLPRAILQHFTHIPWPAPAYWQLLPSIMARSICENLCANDIVGMQTIASVRNFLHTCQNYSATCRGR